MTTSWCSSTSLVAESELMGICMKKNNEKEHNQIMDKESGGVADRPPDYL
jgi:hypothetical protein